MVEALVLLSCCKWALCMLPQSGQKCSQARAESLQVCKGGLSPESPWC